MNFFEIDKDIRIKNLEETIEELELQAKADQARIEYLEEQLEVK